MWRGKQGNVTDLLVEVLEGRPATLAGLVC